MTYIYIYYIFIIFITCNGFGIDKILVPKMPQTVHKLIANEPPKEFNSKSIVPDRYSNMNSAIQCIVDYLNPGNSNKASLYNYTKKNTFTAHENYIIIKFIEHTGTTHIHYHCFDWKKKSYSSLTGLEKYVADYYQANSKTDINFLYPYKRTDKDVTGKIDNTPWAIKIDNHIHSFLWMEANLRDYNTQDNSFIIVEPKDQNKLIKVLVDENNQILAKSINGVITYRTNK